MLQELINQIPTLVSFIESAPSLPETERKLYLSVIGHFKPSLQMAMPPRVDNRELRFLFFWPLHLQPEFLAFLRQRHSGALAILMYYSTVLFASQSRYWFMEGWGERLMRACFEELEQDWQPAVQWPLSFINYSPTYNLFTNLSQAQQSSSTTTQGFIGSNLGFPQRRPVEVPYMNYATTPHLSHGSRAEANMASYTPHAAVSIPPQDQNARTSTYAKQSGSVEDTE